VTDPLLSVEDLSLEIDGAPVLRGVTLSVAPGRALAVVGESGSGKSLTCLSVLGLLPPGGRVVGGRVLFRGADGAATDLLALSRQGMRRVRGGGIAMIFQDAAGALNPLHTVGGQIAETLGVHRGLRGRAARDEAERLLRAVGFPDPRRAARSHPHQLSGGMCQRAMIAMAVAGRPRLLIADEPTTALDVTVQAQILDLLQALRAETGMALVLVTHDLGVAAETADDIAVMHAGRVVEAGPVGRIFAAPRDPYTRMLLGAVADVHGPAAAAAAGG
jgi:peptide/nickel transport system ATP-binding protein